MEAGYKPVFDLKTKQNKNTFLSRKMHVKFYIKVPRVQGV